MEQEIEDAQRKIASTQSNLENTELDLQKKKELIMETEHKLRVLREGGKVASFRLLATEVLLQSTSRKAVPQGTQL